MLRNLAFTQTSIRVWETKVRLHNSATTYCYSTMILGSFAVVPLLVSISSSSPLPHTPTVLQPFPLVSRQTPDSQCTVVGNSDLYGLGIRIGIYLQWASGLLANTFHADSVGDMLATNTIFLMALFIALAIITANETVIATEVMILLQFCFGFLFTVSSTWGLRVSARQLNSVKEYKKRVDFPLFGSAIRLCLASAICAYNVWFWFIGVGKLSDSVCHPVGFLFAPVDLLRRARVFLKITSILIVTFFGGATFSELVLLVCNWILYSLIAGFIALLIAFHRDLHSDALPTERRSILVLALKYTPVVLGGIPWIMMNGDTGVGFKRLQSWAIVAAVMALLGICVLIVFSSLLSRLGDTPWLFYKAMRKFSAFLRLYNGVAARKEAKGEERTNFQDGQMPPVIEVPQPPSPIVMERAEAHPGTTPVQTSNRSQLHLITNIEERNEPKTNITGINPVIVQQTRAATSLRSSQTSVRVIAEEVPLSGRLSETEDMVEEQEINIAYPNTVTQSTISGLQPQTGPPKRNGISNKARDIWNELGDTDFSTQIPPWVLPIINLVCVIWSILAIELMIKWNNIIEVNTIQSVGQLIPFVIGVVGFLKLLRDISIERTQLWIYEIVLVRHSTLSLVSRWCSEADMRRILS